MKVIQIFFCSLLRILYVSIQLSGEMFQHIHIPGGRFRQQTRLNAVQCFITNSKQLRNRGKMRKWMIVKREILASGLQSRIVTIRDPATSCWSVGRQQVGQQCLIDLHICSLAERVPILAQNSAFLSSQ